MYMSSCIFSIILAATLSLSYVQCKDGTLTPFGERVKRIIPKITYIKNFSQNYTDVEDLEKTEKTLPVKFKKVLSTQLDPCLIKLLHKAITRALETKQEGALFQAHTGALSDILTQLGKLNSRNVDQLAKDYVEALNKSAKKVPDDNSISDTLPALITAQAQFLKGAGITSENDVNQFIKYLTQQFDKVAMAANGKDSAMFNLPVDLMENVYILEHNPGLLTSLVNFIKSLFQIFHY